MTEGPVGLDGFHIPFSLPAALISAFDSILSGLTVSGELG